MNNLDFLARILVSCRSPQRTRLMLCLATDAFLDNKDRYINCTIDLGLNKIPINRSPFHLDILMLAVKHKLLTGINYPEMDKQTFNILRYQSI
jgi:hypothetical protein